MKKKIEFSIATTTDEIKAILATPENMRTYLQRMAVEEEAEKRDMAIKIANSVPCGLLIQVYEYRTEYFLDFDQPEGNLVELKFGGMNDDRNV